MNAELVAQDHRAGAGRVRRHRGDLEGADHAAHAADERHNAIHGIVHRRGDPGHGVDRSALVKVLGMIAIAFGTINVVGGFLVTDRMLEMFKRKPGDRARDG